MALCHFTIEMQHQGRRSHLEEGEIAWFEMVPPLSYPCTAEYYLDGHLLPQNAGIGDRFGNLVFRGATADGQIRVQSLHGGIPDIRIVKKCFDPDCEAEATFNLIEIEVDGAKMAPGQGISPDPSDPHWDPNKDWGFAVIPKNPDQFGPEDHPFGSIGALGGSFIQNGTGKPVTDIHIRVKNGRRIKRVPHAGGTLFPDVAYDPDGRGVTFSGGSINPGDWFWMRIPKANRGEYEGHFTPNK